MSLRARETKAKINKWSYMKHKKTFAQRLNSQQIKKPLTELEKIFANDMSNMVLAFQNIQRTHRIKHQKMNNPIKNERESE